MLLKNTIFKDIQAIPSLLLQKPSKMLMSKDHIKVLQRRRNPWKREDIEELIFETTTIQDYHINRIDRLIGRFELLKSFDAMVKKGNVTV